MYNIQQKYVMKITTLYAIVKINENTNKIVLRV